MYALTEVSAEEKSAFLWDGGEKVPVITVQQETGEGQMKSGKVSSNEPHRNDAAGTALQVPNSSMRSGKTARARLSERKMKSSIANAVTQQGGGQRGREPEATNTDIMASMANSLAGFTSFKFTTGTADSEEEEEVHNAWGEDDTEDNLLDRVHDLEQARGIALGPARSAARMRRARKNKRDKPGETAGRSSPRPIEGSNADTLTAASSMMTNMFNSFATSVSFNVTQAKPSGIDATELFAASTSEMPTASMAVPMLQPQSAGRERFAARKGLQKQSGAPAAETMPQREPEATNTDIMASMANSLAGFTSFKFTTGTADSEEEEEVHNAWGEDDTEDNLLDRVHDLEQARGIALGPARSAARMRRARKNKRDKPGETAGRSSPRPIEGSNADTLTAASSMMTNMFNSFATSVSFTVTQAKPSGIDATELSAASTSEMPTASMAVPMLQPQSAGRERFRRRKDRLDPASSTCSKDRQSSLTASQGTESHVSSQGQLQGLLDTTSPARQRLARRNLNAFTVTVKQEETSNSQNRSTFLAAAASSLVEFQKLFQTTSEEGETYSIWGPDDTPEQYQQRLNAMERAQREPASSALHDRLMRRRKRRQDQNKQDGLRVSFFLEFTKVPFAD